MRAGDAEVILRTLPFLAGVAAIPAMYVLSRQFLANEGAYFVTAITAVSTSQIIYSQETREYSIAFLVAILMLTLSYRYMREPTNGRLALTALIFVIGFFTQYGLVLMAVALDLLMAFYLIINPDRRQYLIAWSLAQLVLISAGLLVFETSVKPQLAVGFSRAEMYASGYWNGSIHSLVQLGVSNTLNLFIFAFPSWRELGYSVLIFSFLPLGILFAAQDSNGRKAIAMLLAPMAITIAAAMAGQYPYLGGRWVIYLTPMIYLAAGFGFIYFWKLERGKYIALFLALIIVFSGLVTDYRQLNSVGGENIRPVIAELSSEYRPGDRIYVYYGATPAFNYYYRQNPDQQIHSVRSRDNRDTYLAQMDELLAQEGRVWMVFSHCFPGECELISERASDLRDVELVKSVDWESKRGTRLYLAN